MTKDGATTYDEAMKLALEALKSCDAAHITDGGRQWYDEKLVDKAVEAIEKALTSEAKEQPAPATELREQGPVALEQERKAFEEWIDSGFINKGHAAFHKFSDRDAYCIDEIQNKWKAWEERAKRTTPPAQRTWVRLTDEDIKEAEWLLSAIKEHEAYTLQEQLLVEGVDVFARAIEAKLREKNSITKEQT